MSNAWLCDVLVAQEHTGRGVDLKRFVLATADAHGLNARFGFESMAATERWLVRRGAKR